MAKNNGGEDEKIIDIGSTGAGPDINDVNTRVNNCITELQKVLEKYSCAIDHYYIIHGDKVIPQLKIVPRSEEPISNTRQ